MTHVPTRYAHAIVCEDVRQEVGNKLSLMGLWGPDLNIEGVPPLVIPKLAIVGWIVSPVARPISTATIRVRPLDQPELVQPVEFPDHVPTRINAVMQFVQFAIGLGNLSFSGSGMIETLVEIDGETYLANRTHVNLISAQNG